VTRPAFAFIFITVLLDMLALGVMIPVLPKLVVEFLGGDNARAATIYGLFGTVWAAMQFVFSPVIGSLSDRYGRRPVILLSNFGLGLDYIFMALAPTLGWLFVGRVISGITSSSFATAGAYIADVTPPDGRAKRFGMLGAAFGFGFIAGPAVGGLLGSIDLRLPFWTAAALSLLNAAYGLFVLPESLPPERRTAFEWRTANPVGAVVLLRSDVVLLGLGAAAFLSRVAHDALPSTFVLYATYRYAWDERTIGFTLAAVGVSSLIVSAVLIGPIVRRIGERHALFVGLGAGILGFVVYAVAPTGGLFFIGVPIMGLYGLSNPALQALLSRRVGDGEQGRLQGAVASLMGIAGVVAPVLFTFTFALFVGTLRDLHAPGAPWILAAALLFTAMVVSGRSTSAAVAR
jgi:DHA1 family tetracycline resistance protein-like MFS transporter